MVDQCRSLPTDPTHAREAHTLLAAVALCSARPAQGMGSTQRRESPRQLRPQSRMRSGPSQACRVMCADSEPAKTPPDCC